MDSDSFRFFVCLKKKIVMRNGLPRKNPETSVELSIYLSHFYFFLDGKKKKKVMKNEKTKEWKKKKTEK